MSGAKTLIPGDVLAEVKAAALTGDVVSVTTTPYSFTGKILKVETLTFASGGRLIFEGAALQHPWVAIVAKTIKFSAPEERAFIVLATDSFEPLDGSPYPLLGQAGQGNQGSATNAGGPGHPGAAGSAGHRGSSGQPVPTLYIFADAVLTQPGNVAPDAVDLYIHVRGIDGGNGGPGQDGQHGGLGGSGGPARWNGVTCDGGAGDGGPGGPAGVGGDGGAGGDGSNGGDVYFGGSATAINVLEFSKVNNLPGRRGVGGPPGANGRPGPGGPRGERRGGCGGGDQGPNGASSPISPQRGADGIDGRRGLIFTSSVSVTGLY